MNFTCKICGLPYIPRNAQQVLCGAESCKRENHRRNDKARKESLRHTCQECGDPIPKREGRGRPYILCPDCRARSKVLADKWAGDVECLDCGQVFKSVDRRLNRICQTCKENRRHLGTWQPSEVCG